MLTVTAGCELPLAGVGVFGCKGGTMIWKGVCSLVASGVGRFVVTCCSGVLGVSSMTSWVSDKVVSLVIPNAAGGSLLQRSRTRHSRFSLALIALYI